MKAGTCSKMQYFLINQSTLKLPDYKSKQAENKKNKALPAADTTSSQATGIPSSLVMGQSLTWMWRVKVTTFCHSLVPDGDAATPTSSDMHGAHELWSLSHIYHTYIWVHMNCEVFLTFITSIYGCTWTVKSFPHLSHLYMGAHELWSLSHIYHTYIWVHMNCEVFPTFITPIYGCTWTVKSFSHLSHLYMGAHELWSLSHIYHIYIWVHTNCEVYIFYHTYIRVHINCEVFFTFITSIYGCTWTVKSFSHLSHLYTGAHELWSLFHIYHTYTRVHMNCEVFFTFIIPIYGCT